MDKLDAVLARIDANADAALERLFAVLRIKSISTDPAYAAECRACAEWHAKDLASIGFQAEARTTPGHPIVVAHDRSASGPSALFYGHYDVQPVDPLELWDHDPFEPKIETRADGTKVIRARGAADDKGQLMTFVEACRAWKEVAGALPIPVTMLLEGEEESGGVNLPGFLEANAAELKADIGLICDTNMWDAATPAITTMLRGLVGEEIIVTAADRDLHSGFYGSAAANPNLVVARILADLRDAGGRVTLPGFYDGVPELDPALRRSGTRCPSTPRPSSARRAVGAGGRGGALGAGDDLVAPDLRDQRHGRRLPGRRLQDRDPVEGLGEDLLPAGLRPGPAQGARGLPRLRPRTRAGRLHGGVPRARGGACDPLPDRGAGLPEGPSGADRRVGPRGLLHRRRRLDPGDAHAQDLARDGCDPRGLRARGRPHPQPEREVRPAVLPQGHAVLGAHPARAVA
jgi:acetylornithine deacetylase/succinyl-diaminopimelate desuccinylase-like protein